MMSADPATRVTRSATWLSLALSASTLVCCALPALMVAIGAGAVLAGLFSQLPQLIWLSEHKAAVFGLAATALFAAGWLQWRARRMPCPSDPALAMRCARLRRFSFGVYGLSLLVFGLGAWFAFGIAPL